MQTYSSLIRPAIAWGLAMFILAACKKDSGPKPVIQHGDTTVEINAIYPQSGYAHFIQVRYNNVLSAPIALTITFYLKGGEKQDLHFTISAGYKNLQEWGPDSYINTWEYIPTTQDWEVDSIKIKSVTSADKEYGFKVLGGEDDWTFYKPTDPITSI
ncbi:MAG TPA: hypothetical protein VHA52_04970, partial [Candidatus Babeliaceae bacterium]|nr:hypothetical protein [Candidatus Babeliaceae bacterium]